mgnify:CR=1 FL=1
MRANFVQSTVAILVLLVGGSCSDMTPRIIEVRGSTYKIPNDEIVGFVAPPERKLYLRVAPKGERFHLVIDELDHYLANRQGPDVPTISRLNSNRFWDFSVMDRPFGKVVCGGPYTHYNCGFRIVDQNTNWSVLFDRKDVNNLYQIELRARQSIERYRI